MSATHLSESPLVSICVPAYNHGPYVQECITAIIAQDYENIELIIIDDGSKDNTADAIRSLVPQCQKRFKRFEFISRSNQGVSHTLNEGLAWSQGSYFSGFASDDVMLPNKISILVQHLEKVPQCAGVFGGLKVFSKRTDSITGYQKTKPKTHSFADIFLLKTTLPAPGALLRMSSLQTIGGYNPHAKVEDWDMWLRFTAQGFKLDTIKDFVALYRRHDTNVSGNFDLMHKDMCSIAQQYSAHPLYKKCQAKLRCIRFRDLAVINKMEAVKMLPAVTTSLSDIRFYQGIFNLMFKW